VHGLTKNKLNHAQDYVMINSISLNKKLYFRLNY